MDKNRTSMARSVFAVSVILITVVTTFSILRGVTSAAAPSILDVSKGSPPPTPVVGCWQVVGSPNPGSGNSRLYAIAPVGTNDIWAVGYNGNNTLAEHWNGSGWNIVPSPSPGSQNNVLRGISALTANDIWAVGSADGGPLTVHWDGTQWNLVPSPTNAGLVVSVAAISTNDVWAVGNQTMHWDGTAWSLIANPAGVFLNGVDGVASNDVWAVGDGAILHWEGTSWTNVADNIPPSTCYFDRHGEYKSVSARASNDVWAVGYCATHDGVWVIYANHWDGIEWSFSGVPSVPGPDSGLLALNSVKAVAANDVWVVGTQPDFQGNQHTLVEQWDGSEWSPGQAAEPGTYATELYGITTTGGDNLWTIGFFSSAGTNDKTLVESYPTCPPPPPCPGERFTDVCPGDYFYTATLALADDGILSGYNTVPPCNNSLWIPCFKPYNSSTRGQISKVISLAAGFNEPVSGQTFEDVPPGSTFFTYTERMAERNIISGYACGGPGEPYVPPDNRPYFRTNNNVTRGQLSKMVALAFGWNDHPAGQDFEDVPPGSPVYTYVAQLHGRSIISGYPCGGAGEPCVPPDNLPYFRPNNDVTRGQIAKIVQLARTQPTPTPTAVATLTAVATMTATSVATSTQPVSTDTPAPVFTSTTTPTETATLTTR